jgi:hypothetical protein
VSYLKLELHLFNTDIMKQSSPITIDMDSLNEKYDDLATDYLLDITSLVDPLFKSTRARTVTQMVNEGHENPSPGQGDVAAASPQLPAKKSLWAFFFQKATTGLTEIQLVEKELSCKLQSTDADCETNPLDWWTIDPKNFP